MEEEKNTPNLNNESQPSPKEEVVSPAVSTPADFYEIPAVRTYKADVNQSVTGDKMNLAKILIAEQKKKEKIENKFDSESIEKPSNKIKLSLSVFLIALAVVVVLYASYAFLIPKINNNQNLKINNPGELFVTDKKEQLNIAEKSREELETILQNFLQADYGENTISELVLLKTKEQDGEKITEKINSKSILALAGIEMPDEFVRSLSNNYVLGVYTKNLKKSSFIVFKLDDFDIAYSSAFEFENKMIYEMRNFFGGFGEFEILDNLKSKKIELLPEEKINTATSTASSTIRKIETPVSATTTNELTLIEEEILRIGQKIDSYKSFIDIVLQNTDSRAIIGENSKVLFYYTFIDQQWVLFATDPDVLKEVKRRIREKNLVR